jgi:uncharacterized membrane protein YqaE (UPF0057 family)
MTTPKDGSKDFFRLGVAFVLPPLAVLWQVGFKPQLLLNVLIAFAQVVVSIVLLYEDLLSLASTSDMMATLQNTVFDIALVPVIWLAAVVHAIWVIAMRDDQGNVPEGGFNTFVSLLIGTLVPPLGVVLKRGFTWHALASIPLTAMCIVPGQVFAAWVITSEQ